MASLGVLPDPGLGNPLVMTVGPCPACAERADGEWKWGRCQTPSEADAKLIAAAPELLEALRRIADCDKRYLSSASCMDIARAAIALTTQEKPT